MYLEVASLWYASQKMCSWAKTIDESEHLTKPETFFPRSFQDHLDPIVSKVVILYRNNLEVFPLMYIAYYSDISQFQYVRHGATQPRCKIGDILVTTNGLQFLLVLWYKCT